MPAVRDSNLLVPRAPPERPGSSLSAGLALLPPGLQSSALTHPPSSAGAFQLGRFSQDINGAGGKCRGRRIKVFPRINRRKKEERVPVGTRPWSGALSPAGSPHSYSGAL